MMSHNYFKSSALFVLVVNMNQTYLYYGPAYFVYLLTSTCNPLRLGFDKAMKNFLTLSAIVLVGFGVSILPFHLTHQAEMLYFKVFPFFTGLVFGDFWAPNSWALYNGLDTILILIKKYWDPDYHPSFQCDFAMQPALSAFVPEVFPIHTAILIGFMLVPILWKLWQCPNQPLAFLKALILCCFTMFMLGWYD